MALRWSRRQLRTNLQKEFLCPHFDVEQPWVISPTISVWEDGKFRALWNPGPSIRECCIERSNELAFAAWWWEARNRFEEFKKNGIQDSHYSTQILAQLDIIEQELAFRIPQPSKGAMRQYLYYREDSGRTSRRIRIDRGSFKTLGLDWPCTMAALKKRWNEVMLKSHPDYGGTTELFQRYLQAYNRAKATLSKHSHDLVEGPRA